MRRIRGVKQERVRYVFIVFLMGFCGNGILVLPSPTPCCRQGCAATVLGGPTRQTVEDDRHVLRDLHLGTVLLILPGREGHADHVRLREERVGGVDPECRPVRSVLHGTFYLVEDGH